MRKTYTKEMLEPIVLNNTSCAGVIRELGLKLAGGTQAYISKRIKDFGISTDHFVRVHNKGKTDPKRLSASEILVKRSDKSFRQKTDKLRRALLEIGRPYACSEEICCVSEQWNGKKIVLHIDHIDGDIMNNVASNLRFLCPNCHSQTATYCKQKQGGVA